MRNCASEVEMPENRGIPQRARSRRDVRRFHTLCPPGPVASREGVYKGRMHWFETRHPTTGERLEVELAYERPHRGVRDRFGVPEEPDEPGELQIARVRSREGEIVDFSPIEDFLYQEALARWRARGEADFFRKTDLALRLGAC